MSARLREQGLGDRGTRFGEQRQQSGCCRGWFLSRVFLITAAGGICIIFTSALGPGQLRFFQDEALRFFQRERPPRVGLSARILLYRGLGKCRRAWDLEMRSDSNQPRARRSQMKRNNVSASSSGAMANAGFCPWLGSDIAGGGAAASESSPTAASFFSSSALQVLNASLLLGKSD